MTKLLVALALAAAGAMGSAHAQTYPTRPITVIVPFAGGSASDVVMRIMLDQMSKVVGQPFIVDNRPGAGGNTGTAAAVKVAPDCSRFMIAGTRSSATVNTTVIGSICVITTRPLVSLVCT